MNIGSARAARDRLISKYSGRIEALGYNMAARVKREDESFFLGVRIRPRWDSKDPIPKEVYDLICYKILNADRPFLGFRMDIKYSGDNCDA